MVYSNPITHGVGLALPKEISERDDVVLAVARARRLHARGHLHTRHVGPVTHSVRVARDRVLMLHSAMLVSPLLNKGGIADGLHVPLERQVPFSSTVQHPEDRVVRCGAREHLARVADVAQRLEQLGVAFACAAAFQKG